MSEAMAIESIAEEYTKFQGFLTETRVPFKVKIDISDFDVFGYNPQTKKSLVIECKASGSPDEYPSHDTPKRKKAIVKLFKKILDKWAYFKDCEYNRWKIKRLDKIWLIIPGSCNEDTEKGIKEELTAINSDIDFKIMPIHKLILAIIREVKKDKDVRRKRYPNAALEFCRWLLRSYTHGHLNLLELEFDIKEGDEQKSYEMLRKALDRFADNYFAKCLSVIGENAKEVDTRKKAIRSLAEYSNNVISPAELSNKSGLKYSRIKVGLGTWKKLGIISQNNAGEYFITEPFRDTVDRYKNRLF